MLTYIRMQCHYGIAAAAGSHSEGWCTICNVCFTWIATLKWVFLWLGL